MKKAWNEMKERRFDKRTEKLKNQALQYIQENENLERHIAELQGSNTAEIMEPTRKNDDENKKTKNCTEPPEKSNNKEISQRESKSEIASKHDSKSETKESDENGRKSIIPTNKRPRKRSTKRCHLCRKRGHIKKECPFSPVLQDWP